MAIECKSLSEDFLVSGQISPTDLADIIELGVKSIVINRPDNEKPGQAASSEIIELAEKAHLQIEYMPMFPGRLSEELVQGMVNVMDTFPKPILAYCASGTRSSILWCCANVRNLGVDAVLNRASDAGYDLQQIRPILVQLSQ